MSIDLPADASALSQLFEKYLLDDVLPFWIQHSMDEKYGGYFTCLDQAGNVFDTDKFIWLQCRQVWTFAKFYNEIDQNERWLEVAIHGADFLEKNGRDGEGAWYFALDRTGLPLVQPYNIFSDCFAAMAFGQLYRATQKEKYQKIAVDTFHHILERRDHPKGKYSKVVPGTRPLKNFALPMILSNLVLELEGVLDEELTESTIGEAIHTVMDVFYHPDYNIILENVLEDGSFSDTFDGRLMNPGHVLEAMWFMMDLGRRNGDRDLISRAVDISLSTLEMGWDNTYGGLFYFMDIMGHPPQQLEWDQKLWWVHLEAMVATLKGYSLTQNEEMKKWFVRLYDYTMKHFPDPEYGEWYGYLNRRGEVLLPLKGGKWKGCFHVPRGLYQIARIMKEIAAG